MNKKPVAIVTGVAGDIGFEIAKSFLSEGVHVVGGDISEPGLTNAKDRLEAAAAANARFCPMQLDIRDGASVEALFSWVEAEFGGANILVNNAGGISAETILSATETDWLQDLDLNLIGAWRCIKSAVPLMVDQGGVIINISSANGLGVYGHPGYSAAKAGLIHLTKSATVELGPHNVRAVAICPGTVKTQAWQARQAENPEIIEDAKKWYPMRDVCAPEDVANLVSYTALHAPKVLTGAVISLDGGLTAGQDVVASAFAGVDMSLLPEGLKKKV